MKRATDDDWRDYYENSVRRRETLGGDPFLNHCRRVEVRRKVLLMASLAILVGLFVAAHLFCRG